MGLKKLCFVIVILSRSVRVLEKELKSAGTKIFLLLSSMHFGLFDPLRMKIGTLPPICFMFYYSVIHVSTKVKFVVVFHFDAFWPF